VARQGDVRTSKLLLIAAGAGSVTPEVEAKLRRSFAGYRVVQFNPRTRLEDLLTPRARVILAGGDGTVEWVTRRLVDSRRSLGILPLGTYNNFAFSVGIPADLDAAINAIQEGRPRPVTIGRVNGRPFLEVASVGMFGEALRLGEAAKDLAFGRLTQMMQGLATSEPFEYRLSGDIEGHGATLSLVFANTASTGARLTVATGKTPMDPHLELQVRAGESYRDLVRRMIRSRLRAADRRKELGMSFKFRHLVVETKPRARVFADASPAGRTPAVIDAEAGALRLILPKSSAPRRATAPERTS
jgi:diacylglycerol kinase family enzyme